jgi:hypothetical protein
MTLQERLVEEMKDAMRTGQAEKLSVIRMVRASLKNREIERGKGKPLTDSDVMEVILSGIKQRRDAIEQFGKGGRATWSRRRNARSRSCRRSFLRRCPTTSSRRWFERPPPKSSRPAPRTWVR